MNTIRIGTRNSKLALKQTHMFIQKFHGLFPHIKTEIVYITTKGDKITDTPLSQIGGNGLFVREIENALLSDKIDAAVHSAKDLPYIQPHGLAIGAVLERGNPKDALVMLKETKFINAPSFVVGTGSMRRRVNMKRLYDSVSFADIRGNVDTRISKLKNHSYDALILAFAGLERLDILKDDTLKIIPFEESIFVPSACQGIIAVQCRQNSPAHSLISQINHQNTFFCFQTEQEVLRLLNAGCNSPTGTFAHTDGENINLIISADGNKIIHGKSKISERLNLAKKLSEEL